MSKFLISQAVVLSQFLSPEVDYSVAFGMAIEKTTNDASDSLYGFIWDLTILEFLINLHTKRNEMAKRQQAVRTLYTCSLLPGAFPIFLL